MTFTQPITRSILLPMVDAIASNSVTVASLDYGVSSEVIVSSPAEYAGTYSVGTSDVANGPFVLVLPSIEGDVETGQVLSLVPGLYAHSVTGGTPEVSIQWVRGNLEIVGATGATYVVQEQDLASGLSVRVTATNGDGTNALTVLVEAAMIETPTVVGTLPDLTLEIGSGDKVVDATAAFSGTGLVYSVQGGSAAIDSKTGLVMHTTDGLLSNEVVTVTATNSAGSAEAHYQVSVTNVAPLRIGTLADQIWTEGDGPQTLDASVVFAGSNLEYAIAGAGVLIDNTTGVVTHSTNTPTATQTVTVTASNTEGIAQANYSLTVNPTAPSVIGNIPDQTWIAGAGSQFVETASAFSGSQITYAVSGLGAAIDPVSGLVSHSTAAPQGQTRITVTATNVSGSASIDYMVAVQPASPMVVGSLDDQSFPVGSGTQTVDASTVFSGTELTYSVSGANALVDSDTGIVSHDTSTAVTAQIVTVTATNMTGSGSVSYTLTIDETGSHRVVDSIANIDVELVNNGDGTHSAIITGTDTDYTSHSPVLIQDSDLESGLPINLVPSPIEEDPESTFNAKPGLWISPTTDPASFVVQWFEGGTDTGGTDYTYSSPEIAQIELHETATNLAGSEIGVAVARSVTYGIDADIANLTAVFSYDGTKGVTHDGTRITNWADQTANGYNLAKNGTSTLPGWNDAEKCIDTTVNWGAICAPFDITPMIRRIQDGTDFAHFVVAEWTGATPNGGYGSPYGEGQGGSSHDRFIPMYLQFESDRTKDRIFHLQKSTTQWLGYSNYLGDLTPKAIWEFRYSNADDEYQFYINGVLVKESGPVSSHLDDLPDDLTQCPMAIGAGSCSATNAIGTAWRGKIWQLHATENVTVSNVDAIRSELAATHGITLP